MLWTSACRSKPADPLWWVACFRLFFFIPLRKRFMLATLQGGIIYLSLAALGMIVLRTRDIRHNKYWIGRGNYSGYAFVAKLDEPLSERPGTYKSLALAEKLVRPKYSRKATGRILLYFRKDSSIRFSGFSDDLPEQGKRIIFFTKPHEIVNSGNPGEFDYRSYQLHRGVTHQVFLKQGEYLFIGDDNSHPVQKILSVSRKRILSILRKYIPGEKEKGLAEALLIGYREDMDRELVQSYSRTGVVHIIAISGLHLGLIYGLLSFFLKPLTRLRRTPWLRPLLVIAGLWTFSLLAGAQPSVLRAALMFSCIVAGESLNRRSGVYNALAMSAFLLLCINPFWLWDIGFQLSYTAVLSIVLFSRALYTSVYIRNKWPDRCWKMCSVTLAAQVLTVPLCIWHFHQFPVYFLLANLMAVPLSGLILFAEIILCLVSFFEPVARLAGQLIQEMIRLMNMIVQQVEALPGATLENLQISFIQVILLYLLTAGFTYWIFIRSKTGFFAGLSFLAGFMIIRSFSFVQRGHQQFIVVYNIPGKQAIDLVRGRTYVFLGDVDRSSPAWYFNLRPARTLFRTKAGNLAGIIKHGPCLQFAGKKILLIENKTSFSSFPFTENADLLILSGRFAHFPFPPDMRAPVRQVVIDASVPVWQTGMLKSECEKRGIPCHPVREAGAFVMQVR
ncbi:MAG: ComEC/Rec2 family competence protein [Chitinophagaceae bacterium]